MDRGHGPDHQEVPLRQLTGRAVGPFRPSGLQSWLADRMR